MKGFEIITNFSKQYITEGEMLQQVTCKQQYYTTDHTCYL